MIHAEDGEVVKFCHWGIYDVHPGKLAFFCVN